jgi:hypothetical protein
MVTKGFKVSTIMIGQGNTSSMKLEEKGKISSGERTQHFNAKYIDITNSIQWNKVQIEYLPTDAMIADYMTKPLVASTFLHLCKQGMHMILRRILVQRKCVEET